MAKILSKKKRLYFFHLSYSMQLTEIYLNGRHYITITEILAQHYCSNA